MKLLIITQKVDKNDGVLGFFHNWIVEFAKHCEKLTVICLYKGECDLPVNVKVLSLGKENGQSKLKYIFKFYKYIWKYRKDYDSIFVHMNQIYVLLGGFFWKLMKKKIVLWYNHISGNLLLEATLLLSDRVCYTSPFSYVAKKKLKKSEQMPAGIDTNIFFDKNNIREKKSILCVGRISTVKNIDVLIDTVSILDKDNLDFCVYIYGNPTDRESDRKYFEKIKNESSNLIVKNRIKFFNEISNYKIPEIYNRHEIYVNMTNSGSLDKTVLEALSCGCITIVSNESYGGIIDNQFIFKERDVNSFVNSIKKAFDLNDQEKEELRKSNNQYVKDHHALNILVIKILNLFQ